MLVNLLNDRIGDLSHAFGAAFEQIHCTVEHAFGQLFLLFVFKFFFRKRNFHGKYLKYVHLAAFIVGSFHCIGCTIPDHVDNIHTDTFTHQGMATFGIDNRTLFVHDVIVFQQAFTDTEVVLFNFLLCTFDGFGNHAVLDHLTFLETKFVHYSGDTVGREQTHQVVFQ